MTRYQMTRVKVELTNAFRAQSIAFKNQDKAAMAMTTQELEWKIAKFKILYGLTEAEIADIEYEAQNLVK